MNPDADIIAHGVSRLQIQSTLGNNIEK